MSRIPLIHLSAVSKAFLTDDIQTNALSEVDFQVATGEFVSISGPSGCGKSTLLSILGMLDTVSSGQYLFNGLRTEELNEAARAELRSRSIGFVFQSFNLLGDMTILDNVQLPLRYRHDISRRDRERRAVDVLEKVGMGHRMKHFPAQLSGGQQQRVAVARALVGAPSVLLADEPTGNLDSANGDSVMQLLSDLHASGATICMVTHDTRYSTVAERQVVMLDGRINPAGESRRVLQQTAESIA